MRSNTILVVLILVTLVVAVLVLLAGGYLPESIARRLGAQGVAQGAQLEQEDVQFNAVTTVVASPEPVEAQASPQPDGFPILEKNCSQCHALQQLQKIEKSRDEWEESISFMKWMGVRLSEPEKDILIDYLAGTDE